MKTLEAIQLWAVKRRLEVLFPTCTLAYLYKQPSDTHFFQVRGVSIHDNPALMEGIGLIYEKVSRWLPDLCVCIVDEYCITDLSNAQVFYTPNK